MTNNFHTISLKLACILVSLGFSRREQDPVTCQEEIRNGVPHKQYTFWFDVKPEEEKRLRDVVNCFHKTKNWDCESTEFKDKDHPIYWMMGNNENHDTYMFWIRNKVVPIREIKHGSKTVLISSRASEKTKNKIKEML
jgi:hypothetical protein